MLGYALRRENWSHSAVFEIVESRPNRTGHFDTFALLWQKSGNGRNRESQDYSIAICLGLQQAMLSPIFKRLASSTPVELAKIGMV